MTDERLVRIGAAVVACWVQTVTPPGGPRLGRVGWQRVVTGDGVAVGDVVELLGRLMAAGDMVTAHQSPDHLDLGPATP